MAAFIAWFSSHSVGIAEVLAVVVAVDHALASSSFFTASSTAQALFTGIATVATWIGNLITPSSGSTGGGTPPPAST